MMNITHSLEDVTSWFFGTLEKLLQSQEIVTVGLAGGSSYDAWYAFLLETQNSKLKTFFPKIRWCVTDERVNCDPSERNDVHIWEVFLSRLCEMGLSRPEYFIRPDMQSDGIEYFGKIRQLGNPPTPPLSGGIDARLSTFHISLLPAGRQGSTSFLDIAFFGMGPDGHTASLFPYHPALQSEELGFIKIDNAPKLPPERISLSPKSIQNLEHVCLGVVGSEKKEALANFLDETVSIEDCPAKILRPEIVYRG